MSISEGYKLNQCYFKLSYCHSKMAIPDIESWVFIGKNIKGNEEDDSWYFQDPPSFCKEDNLKQWSDDEEAMEYFRNLEPEIIILNKNNPDLILYSVEELIGKLKQIPHAL